MKCLLCNDWIESLPKLRDLIMFNQRKEYSCRSCKHQFKNLSKERCQNCNKELYGDACIDCKLWMKKGYIPKHLAIYKYEENMKEYFSRYKFMGDYCLEKRDIEKQSSKTREERLSQDNAFCLKEGINLPDKIIIVDDIYTTGSTLYQMVQLLEAIGIKEVLTFSLAR